jgi:hypothetical protein
VQRFRQLAFPAPLRAILRVGRRLLLPHLAERVARLSSVRRAFHKPRPNNFVWVYVPKTADANAVFQELRTDSEPLNDLDGRLLRFLDDLSRRTPAFSSLEVVMSLSRWKLARKNRSFPSAAAEIEILSQLWERCGEGSLRDLLRREVPDLLDELCQLPPAFRRVERLNFYLPGRVAKELSGRIAAQLLTGEKFTRALRHMEVTWCDTDERKMPAHPSLIVYLLRESEAEDKAQLIAFLLKQVQGYSLPEPEVEFSESLGPGVTFTEGYRLYKTYLRTLGILDRTYDPASGYARALP